MRSESAYLVPIHLENLSVPKLQKEESVKKIPLMNSDKKKTQLFVDEKITGNLRDSISGNLREKKKINKHPICGRKKTFPLMITDEKTTQIFADQKISRNLREK